MVAREARRSAARSLTRLCDPKSVRNETLALWFKALSVETNAFPVVLIYQLFKTESHAHVGAGVTCRGINLIGGASLKMPT
jgi:hypothetical protein